MATKAFISPHPEAQKLVKRVRTGWTWRSDCGPDIWPMGRAPEFAKQGDDIEVMFHGGGRARGLLYHGSWGGVTACRIHGPYIWPKDTADLRDLVWIRRPSPIEEG